MDESVLRKRLVDLGLVPAERLNEIIAKRQPGDPRGLATLVVEAGLFTKKDLLLLTGGSEEGSDPNDDTHAGKNGSSSGSNGVPGDRTQAADGRPARGPGSAKPGEWPPATPTTPEFQDRVLVRDTVQKALAIDPLFAPLAELTLTKHRLLGKGGMGLVLLVQDHRLGRLAALKLMKEDGDTVAIQRFLREAAITSRLDHPGIPPVYEAGRTSGGQHFMLMRYVAGESIAQILARVDGPRATGGSTAVLEFDQRELLGILAKVGDAVAYAHSKRIVHRDLKPSNIMVGSFGEVLVMDWGLARNIEETESMDAALHENRGATAEEDTNDGVTRAGAILGTLGYMAPEQARGEDVDGAADVFSLGAILTEVLTGKPPVTADSVAQLVELTAAAKITLPRQRNPNVAPELDAIVAKALAAKRADRYASAKLLGDDLRAYLEGRPVSAYRYPIAEKVKRLIRRHPTFFATLSVALLLSASALAVIRHTTEELGEVKNELTAASKRDERQERARALLVSARNRFRQGAPLAEVRTLALAAAKDDRTANMDAGLLLAEAGEMEAARLALQAYATEFPPAYAALFALHEIEEGSAGAFHCGPALTELLERARRRGEENEFTALAQCAATIGAGEWEKAREAATRAVAKAPRLGAAYLYRAEVELHAAELESALADADKAVATMRGSAVALDERARVRIARGDFDGALDDVARAIAAVPSDGVSYASRARVELARRQLDAALASATRAVELAPEWAPGWAARAEARLARGELDEAAKDATRALGLDERLALAWSTRAAVRLAKGELDDALDDATKALDRDPRSSHAWATRAATRLIQRDWARALEDATHALELDPRASGSFTTAAAAHLARGELTAAIVRATKAVELDPKSARAWAARATAHRLLGKSDLAVADATKAIELDGAIASAWTDRAWALFARRDLDAALADANEAVRRAPKGAAGSAASGPDLEAAIVRSTIRLVKRDADGAFADGTRATELDPRSPQAWLARAEARLARKEHAEAIADAQRAIDLDPRIARAWAARGVARSARGQLDLAIADLAKALELEPALEAAWAARAQARLKKGDTAGAIQDQGKLLELAPKTTAAWLERASMKASSGDLDGAIADYGKALELDKRSAPTWSRRAAARLMNRDLDGAIDDYGKALDLDPRNARTWNDRGFAKLLRGDVDTAFNDLDRALALEPGLADAYANRSEAWRKKGDLDRAIQDAESGIRLDPRCASAWCMRGLVRWQRDEHAKAADDYSTAIKLDPRLVRAWLYRGEAKQARSDIEGAIDDWTHALQVDARCAEAYRLRGLARALRSDDAAAIDDLTRFVAIAPDSPWAGMVRGKLVQLRSRSR